MNTNTDTWIATAYDSDRGYALGKNPEEAAKNYREQHGEPPYKQGFSVIRNREDFKYELARVSQLMGYEESMPMLMTCEWITIARATPNAIAALEGRKQATHLLHDWSQDDGQYFLTAPAPLPPLQQKPKPDLVARRKKAADIQPVDNIHPSERQLEWAKKHPYDWFNKMAQASRSYRPAEEIQLTQEEIAYVRALRANELNNDTTDPIYWIRQ